MLQKGEPKRKVETKLKKNNDDEKSPVKKHTKKLNVAKKWKNGKVEISR